MYTDTARAIWTIIGWLLIIFLSIVIKRLYLPKGFPTKSYFWKLVKISFFGATIVPGLWFPLFYSYVLRAKEILGEWPKPYQPDPKSLDLSVHYTMLYMWFPLVGLSLIIMVLLLPHVRNMIELGAPVKKCYSIYLISFILLSVIGVLDPGNFIEWFFD